MKVVINERHGGFGLSAEAMVAYKVLKGIPLEQDLYPRNIDRHDLILVSTVLMLGERADGPYSRLKVIDIPDDIEYVIQEYDGKEWIAEAHRTWQ